MTRDRDAGGHHRPGPDERAGQAGPQDSSVAADRSTVNPAGFCHGHGLIVVHGNAAFKRLFGSDCIGLPAREGMLGLSRDAFTVMDAVLDRGKPAARWVRYAGGRWRLTVAPRKDPESGETYGVAFHLSREGAPAGRRDG